MLWILGNYEILWNFKNYSRYNFFTYIKSEFRDFYDTLFMTLASNDI